MKKTGLLLGVVTILVFTGTLHAQDSLIRKVGISATIQDNQFGFLIPVFINNHMSLSPAFDFKYAQRVGTDFSIGLVPKFYLKTGKISPFIAFRIGAMINYPSSINQSTTKNTIDWVGGIGFGGEYFIDKNFSFGIELQGTGTISDVGSDRFGNPGGFNFNTATVVSVNMYF